MHLRPRSALLAGSVLLAAVVAAVTAPTGADADQRASAAPLEVIVELRVWQHVRNTDSIWVSARPKGGDWRTLGTIPLWLDDGEAIAGSYRYGDLTVAGAELRIWQRVSQPERFFVCGSACPNPWLRSITRPLGMIPLPLGDGRSPDGRYRYGDITVATAPGSPELLADRVRLLAIRDALDGRRTLNWDHGTAMTAWTGVTVGGTPPRVTKLQLSDRGLSGEISGLLGNLGADQQVLDTASFVDDEAGAGGHIPAEAMGCGPARGCRLWAAEPDAVDELAAAIRRGHGDRDRARSLEGNRASSSRGIHRTAAGRGRQ